MHINLLRDIPLALGIIFILIGFARGGSRTFAPCATPDGENPQWFCRVVLNFVGLLLIGFGILGSYFPH
ncbi:hypothetical protein [Granulicella arctica]|uniref:Uncharacterized protein n=1 Tax=Granulicella arctica TaxID=940613 RepID=A0A7Y9TG14_9BACT|nr:hypothetical protein [Granulicella arctica]NYF79391.1 hypothetical protein [Granulicella arctica]